jgi:hypothetical protein
MDVFEQYGIKPWRFGMYNIEDRKTFAREWRKHIPAELRAITFFQFKDRKDSVEFQTYLVFEGLELRCDHEFASSFIDELGGHLWDCIPVISAQIAHDLENRTWQHASN